MLHNAGCQLKLEGAWPFSTITERIIFLHRGSDDYVRVDGMINHKVRRLKA